MTAVLRPCALAVCLALATLAWGCQAPRTPEFLDEAFKQSPHAVISVMPIVDARPDKTAANIDSEKELRPLFVKGLAEKGYTVVSLDAGVARPPDAAIADMDAPALAALAPRDADLLMVLFLRDATSTYAVVYSSSKTEIAGVIVDRATGRYVWKDTFASTGGGIGILSALAAAPEVVMQECARTLLSGIPDRPAPAQ